MRALVEAGHEILLVVSQADKRRGRGSEMVASPVKAAAIELGLPTSDNPDDIVAAVAKGAELGIVVAYGRLIKAHLLAQLPFLNIHFSLLPRWRGAAPVERAILAGDTQTGVCLMGLEEGLDTGPVFRREVTEIAADESLSVLRDRLVTMGTAMLVDSLADGFLSLGEATPQEGEFTYASKLDPAEFFIDWTKSAEEINHLVRLGVAWTMFRGKRFKVLSARVDEGSHDVGALDALRVGTGSGSLALVTVQPEGKAAMDAASWRNGAQPSANERFGMRS
jgi:methionyl-tRNA formyltransferase